MVGWMGDDKRKVMLLTADRCINGCVLLLCEAFLVGGSND
jgi:hypothetical protein